MKLNYLVGSAKYFIHLFLQFVFSLKKTFKILKWSSIKKISTILKIKIKWVLKSARFWYCQRGKMFYFVLFKLQNCKLFILLGKPKLLTLSRSRLSIETLSRQIKTPSLVVAPKPDYNQRSERRESQKTRVHQD